MRVSRGITSIALVVAVASLVAACASTDGSGPNDSSSDSATVGGGTESATSSPAVSDGMSIAELPGTFDAPVVEVSAGVQAQVTPEAPTTISALMAPGVTVEFELPAGAVSAPTAVTLRPASIGGYLGVELLPQGLMLLQPAMLHFSGVVGDVYQRDGWNAEGVARFAPTWRTSDLPVAVARLRPLVITHTFPQAIVDPSVATTPTILPVTTLAPTTTTTIVVAPPPSERPSTDFDSDVRPALDNPATDASNGADRGAWQVERDAEDGREYADEVMAIILAGNEKRGAYLAEKCAERTAPTMSHGELSDLLNGSEGADQRWVKDIRDIDGCVVLGWMARVKISGQLFYNGETFELDEVQSAGNTVMLDGGTSSSSGPIFGHSNMGAAFISALASGFLQLGGELTGVAVPPPSMHYCAAPPDQWTGSVLAVTDPLPDQQIRLVLTPTPADFDVGCGEALKAGGMGWALVSLMRGETPGDPMTFTFPLAPQVSRNTGFLDHVEGAKVVTNADGTTQVTVDEVTYSVDFQLLLAFVPAP